MTRIPTCIRRRCTTVAKVALPGVMVFGSISFPLAAQLPEPEPKRVEWWHGALAVGGVLGVMLLDQPVHGFVQGYRSRDSDGFASVVRHFGQPEVYASVGLGLVATGFLTDNPDLKRAGTNTTIALALTWGLVHAGKLAFGRERPLVNGDANEFVPFSRHRSLPSGHTAMAFALATSLADEIDRPVVTVGLYTAATATAWSRLNDNKHWLSDAALGAVLGVTMAKFVNGKWTVLGLRAPSLVKTPKGGVGVGWKVKFE